ncbi:TetR/AcrR family transcriptional regulator [Alicyclobacillus tolerans]|uniref:TetR/AcrR family transcriptional regulator n=1 Tax=Alicyclobacillus tolerans TaxID=90970 RepID=UPI001F31B5E3|nr:TetR/AcrR family transcriptional regulator [Alicyclobacillus tolerans]MCF8565281.1 TetR/AcrR family transcriptional regulator [Alicyclobacillus tolerans]
MGVDIPSNVKDPERIRERRGQIVKAAVRLFSDKGFHKTTTREIAKASGISNGALYEYVGSKEDVLFLVCQHIHNKMEEQLLLRLTGDDSAAQRLRQAIEGLLQVVYDMQADVLLIYQETKSLPPSFLHEVLAKEQDITGIFERLLRDGQQDGSLLIDNHSIPLLAHNIVVGAEMWAFRRWALKTLAFEEFVKLQTDMLMAACGVSKREPNSSSK